MSEAAARDAADVQLTQTVTKATQSIAAVQQTNTQQDTAIAQAQSSITALCMYLDDDAVPQLGQVPCVPILQLARG